jgi:hypothetical protein
VEYKENNIYQRGWMEFWMLWLTRAEKGCKLGTDFRIPFEKSWIFEVNIRFIWAKK